MPGILKIVPFFQQKNNAVLIDVRSESEFNHAHIPGALNIPLLNDENRKIVGTVYKQQGREAAIAAGFELLGPQFGRFYEGLNEAVGGQEAFFYCWRGGMRSYISASVCEWGGNKTTVLSGGYKAYRKYVLQGLNQERKVIIISGYTGSGKTEILSKLQETGGQVIDLEGIANHRGSALGSLGMPPQRSNEMFENILFEHWIGMDSAKPVFLENESRKIGANVIPVGVWDQMEGAPVMNIKVPLEMRLKRILREYGDFSPELLLLCTQKIKKRLGGLNLKIASDALVSGDLKTWAEVLIAYYDRTYAHGRKDKPKADYEIEWDWENTEISMEKMRTFIDFR